MHMHMRDDEHTDTHRHKVSRKIYILRCWDAVFWENGVGVERRNGVRKPPSRNLQTVLWLLPVWYSAYARMCVCVCVFNGLGWSSCGRARRRRRPCRRSPASRWLFGMFRDARRWRVAVAVVVVVPRRYVWRRRHELCARYARASSNLIAINLDRGYYVYTLANECVTEMCAVPFYALRGRAPRTSCARALVHIRTLHILARIGPRARVPNRPDTHAAFRSERTK